MRFSFTKALGLLVLSVFFMLSTIIPALAKVDNDRAKEFRRQGLESQSRADFGNALLFYTRALVFSPNDPVLYNDLGLVSQALKKYDEAKAAFEKALSLDSHFLPVYSNMGSLYIELGQYDLAVIYLKKRLNLGDPRDPWTLKAQELLEGVYVKVPSLKNQRVQDSANELGSQVEQEKKMTRDAVERTAATDFNTAFEHGREAFIDGNNTWAIQHFEEALSINPSSFEARHALERAKQQQQMDRVSREMVQILQDNRGNILNKYTLEAEAAADSGGE